MWTTWPPLQGVKVKQGPDLLFCLLVVIVVIVIVFVVIVLAMIIILLSVVQGETIKRVCLLSYCIRDNHENCLHRSVLIFAGATTRKEAVNISSSQDLRRTKFEEKSQ